MPRQPNKKQSDQQLLLNWDASGNQERIRGIRAIDFRRTGLRRRRWQRAVDVLCCLISCNYEGMFQFQNRIAVETGMSVRSVGRAIRDLVDLGILHSRKRGSTSNDYTIDSQKLVMIGVPDQTEMAEQFSQSVRTVQTKCPNAI